MIRKGYTKIPFALKIGLKSGFSTLTNTGLSHIFKVRKNKLWAKAPTGLNVVIALGSLFVKGVF
jgi:hypothetical protein